MNKELLKIKEFSKEEIINQFNNKEIDIDFMAEYISKRDKVYNKLIDEVNNLGQALNEIKKCMVKDLGQAEELDYYVIRKTVLKIMDKVLGGSDENER